MVRNLEMAQHRKDALSVVHHSVSGPSLGDSDGLDDCGDPGMKSSGDILTRTLGAGPEMFKLRPCCCSLSSTHSLPMGWSFLLFSMVAKGR